MLTCNKINDLVTTYSAKYLSVNASIMEFQEFIVVIDSFLKPSDSKLLSNEIDKINKPVKYIINTHYHSDHFYGNRFCWRDNSLVIGHNNFQSTIDSEKSVLRPSNNFKSNKTQKFCLPDKTFSDKLILDTDPQTQLIHTPGHSSDSITIFLPDYQIVFTGDTILNSNDERFALPYFFWGNHNTLFNSIKKIDKLNITTIIPGHGNPADKEILEANLIYLNNLKQRFNKISQTKSFQNFDKVLHEIPISECLPGYTVKDIWMPKIHEFNLRRLFDQID